MSITLNPRQGSPEDPIAGWAQLLSSPTEKRCPAEVSQGTGIWVLKFISCHTVLRTIHLQPQNLNESDLVRKIPEGGASFRDQMVNGRAVHLSLCPPNRPEGHSMFSPPH